MKNTFHSANSGWYYAYRPYFIFEMLMILIVAVLTVKCLGQTTSSLALAETGGGSTTSTGELATLPGCAVSLAFLNGYAIH